MKMTTGDQQVVSNMRGAHKEAIAGFSDEVVAHAWRIFSQSNEYTGNPETNVFVEWCDMAKIDMEDHGK